MNDNLDVIADKIDEETVKNLYIKFQPLPVFIKSILAVHNREIKKHYISKIINDSDEDKTFIIADLLDASGLEHMVIEGRYKNNSSLGQLRT